MPVTLILTFPMPGTTSDLTAMGAWPAHDVRGLPR
ncbi:hypothetical protein DSM112329_04700 [Paraconexibacter sp. AEG42_29]|uniref:Uncharacterized protein n=1 Tax=Paraconexibacter sp. AEG42_29 TaxID=2997339 RepID=A0AAU7B1L3_9ACTN